MQPWSYSTTVTATARGIRRCATCQKEWLAKAEATGSSDFEQRHTRSGAEGSARYHAREGAEAAYKVTGHSCPFCSGLSTDAVLQLFPRGVGRGLRRIYRRGLAAHFVRFTAGVSVIALLIWGAVSAESADEQMLGRGLWLFVYLVGAPTLWYLLYLSAATLYRGRWYEIARSAEDQGLRLAASCCKESDGKLSAQEWVVAFADAEWVRRHPKKKRDEKPVDRLFSFDLQDDRRYLARLEREVAGERVRGLFDIPPSQWTDEDKENMARFLSMPRE